MALKRARGLLIFAMTALPWSVCAQPRGASTIEAAPSGWPYDYIIHVQNTYDYRYNPEVRNDRVLLAKQIVRPFCSKNRIVGEARFETEIFGLITGRPNYVVYVKCLSWRGQPHAPNKRDLIRPSR
ncbi:hypothetical protein [Bradyrhizobium sp. ARR65]|uniref:hypothetical protein n=1 Tax=Bradyrhizobium sp. ARR65 TaxID=1040989 RepID=UPI000464D074|nr:hypothetical protein [Bradyrhizobium sp. ARR65]